MSTPPADPFLLRFDPPLAGAEGGPLAGLRVAVKDLFDLEGCKTGAGNPGWLDDHPPAARDAAAVAALRAAGAVIAGKAMTDELAYSLAGSNDHYGMPLNGAALERTPGGSSSGSASAVSQSLAEIGLGTDTGGSVRIPACYCGLYGMRPSHGRIPLDGTVPLAPRFDTVSWLTRDAGCLARVGEVLLGEEQPATPTLLVADALLRELSPAAQTALSPAIERIEKLFGGGRHCPLAPSRLTVAAEAYRILQGRDAWRAQGPWIERCRPKLGQAVGKRFAAAAMMTAGQEDGAERVRQQLIADLPFAAQPDALLLLPTAPGPAPHREASADEVATTRAQLMALTCIAGLSGAPQVHLPLASLGGAPFGLSLMAAPGRDRLLLTAVERIAQ